MLKTSPKSLKSQATFSIKQGMVFRHGCAPYFYVERGKLSYALTQDSPSWLTINSQTGMVWGKAPAVYTAKTYAVTVLAKNAAGVAEWKFYLTVTREDFSHEVDPIIQHYLDRKKQKELERAYNPELLEYIYAYLEQADEPETFARILREQAEKLGIGIKAKVSYKDFAKVVKVLAPDIQTVLANELGPESPLIQAQVSAFELQNLFRQGSQPSGALAGPVFNYLAAPTRHIWSVHIRHILNAAAICLMERQSKQNAVELAPPNTPPKAIPSPYNPS